MTGALKGLRSIATTEGLASVPTDRLRVTDAWSNLRIALYTLSPHANMVEDYASEARICMSSYHLTPGLYRVDRQMYRTKA